MQLVAVFGFVTAFAVVGNINDFTVNAFALLLQRTGKYVLSVFVLCVSDWG